MTLKDSAPFIASKTERRGPIAAEYTSPGPASVTLPALVGFRKHDFSRNKEPAFSFGQRRKDLSTEQSPGPGTYNVVGMYTKGGRTISSAATLRGRTRDLHAQATPAPSTYNPEKCQKLSTYPQSPRFSFGGKWKEGKVSDTPGSNQYLVPSTIGRRTISASGKGMRPGFSLSGRARDGSSEQRPGPGAYNLVDPNKYAKSAPSYSMNSRNIVLVHPDAKHKPGPGAHDIRNSNNHRAGGYSFGIRHSAYETPLIIRKD